MKITCQFRRFNIFYFLPAIGIHADICDDCGKTHLWTLFIVWFNYTFDIYFEDETDRI